MYQGKLRLEISPRQTQMFVHSTSKVYATDIASKVVAAPISVVVRGSRVRVRRSLTSGVWYSSWRRVGDGRRRRRCTSGEEVHIQVGKCREGHETGLADIWAQKCRLIHVGPCRWGALAPSGESSEPSLYIRRRSEFSSELPVFLDTFLGAN